MSPDCTPIVEPTKNYRERRAEELILLFLSEQGLEPDGKNLITTRDIRRHFGERISPVEFRWIVAYCRANSEWTQYVRCRRGGLVVRRAYPPRDGRQQAYYIDSAGEKQCRT
jgi:hypothetical protein